MTTFLDVVKKTLGFIKKYVNVVTVTQVYIFTIKYANANIVTINNNTH